MLMMLYYLLLYKVCIHLRTFCHQPLYKIPPSSNELLVKIRTNVLWGRSMGCFSVSSNGVTLEVLKHPYQIRKSTQCLEKYCKVRGLTS